MNKEAIGHTIQDKDINTNFKSIFRETDKYFEQQRRLSMNPIAKPLDLDLARFFESTSRQDPNIFLTLKKQTIRRACLSELKRVEEEQQKYKK